MRRLAWTGRDCALAQKGVLKGSRSMNLSNLARLVRMAALEVIRYGALPHFAAETDDLLSWTLRRRQRIMSRESGAERGVCASKGTNSSPSGQDRLP